MSERTWVAGDDADLIEQSLEVVPDEGDDATPDVGWDSDPADVAEQSRAVGFDDERDPPA